MRTKRHEEANYFAVFNDGNTLRFALDPLKPVLPLMFPEIEDVSLGTRCEGGCPYCYADASPAGECYPRAADKVLDYYGGLSENDRPFQVAIGGGGEPTLHPEFVEALRAFRSLGIVPNYTTNGMHLTQEVLEASEMAGGVAVSCHDHLDWGIAVEKLSEYAEVSLHVVVGEPGSSDHFWDIYDRWPEVSRVVALPYQWLGRAEFVVPGPEWDAFFAEAMKRRPDRVAFGAGFYWYLMERPEIAEFLGVSLYEPEVLSGYRRLDETYRVLRRSSYDPVPKFAKEGD